MMDTVMCMIMMLFGAALFAAGIVFERMTAYDSEEYDEVEMPKEDPEILRQWENLLGYDGNKQEERE